MEDRAIVDMYWQRNEQAITHTANKYGKYCYSIAHNILNDNQDAEESVNDTYNDAWNSMPPHRPSILSTFLGKITRRISIDRYRRKKATKRDSGEMPLILEELENCISSKQTVEDELENKRLAKVLNAFVSTLPSIEQKVFLCRYWYMDSVKSISAQFSYSESKVKSMLFRTREKLKIILIKEGF